MVRQRLPVTLAVVGDLDEAVLAQIVAHARGEVGPVYGKNGKDALLRKLSAYNSAARLAPWIVLVDLDRDESCAPPFTRKYLPDPAPWMRFRVAVREVESWLLADAERLAAFLQIARSRISRDPDNVDDPKQVLINLARHSSRTDIEDDLVPRARSTASVGPAYTSRLIEFVFAARGGWRPSIAARRSDSLRRCLAAARSLCRRRWS